MGCASEGQVEVTAYGEAFIEEGIAAEHFADGWAVTFERFDVSLRNIRVAGKAVPAAQLDLTTPTNGEGQAIGAVTVEEGDYDGASFTIEHMDVAGAAEKGGVSKSFAWAFEEVVAYEDCATVTRVAADETTSFQITIHADHLFHDSLVAEEPALVFQPYADADNARNNDGAIETDGELWEAGIGAFDPGNETAPDLWTWLILAARSIGHADGEAHCTPRVIPAE